MLKELGLVCRWTANADAEYCLVGKVSFWFPPPCFGFDIVQPITSPWSTEIKCPGPSSRKGLLGTEETVVQQLPMHGYSVTDKCNRIFIFAEVLKYRHILCSLWVIVTPWQVSRWWVEWDSVPCLLYFEIHEKHILYKENRATIFSFEGKSCSL